MPHLSIIAIAALIDIQVRAQPALLVVAVFAVTVVADGVCLVLWLLLLSL